LSGNLLIPGPPDSRIEKGGIVMNQRTQLIRQLLGKSVHVIIDRPIGYDHNGLIYPVNYGYIPGILAGDGEEQDIYILGVSQPLEIFTGRIIGVVRRRDDNEDKLVAAPEGMIFTRWQIRKEINFVEKYFDSDIFSIYDGE
jgi:inorganic pyrophosphatase